MKNTKLVIISSFLAIIICMGSLLIYNKLKEGKRPIPRSNGDAHLITLDNKSMPPKRDKSKFKNFPGLKMEKTDLKLSEEGKELNITLPIYIERNRYYLPLTELMDELDGDIEVKDNVCILKLKNTTAEIDMNTNTYKLNNDIHKLREKLIYLENVAYISMFDFTNIFDIKAAWQYDRNSITFFNNREKLASVKSNISEKSALVRLEDISEGESYRYATAEALYKLRIVADYLNSKAIPFHVAWVPRYIDTENGHTLDSDLTKQNSIHNADFLYTLDYFIEKRGIIGLHGYTHQAANETSVVGTEFGNRKDKYTFTDEYAIKRINSAKEAAWLLDIPYVFFEAPHYSAPPNQLRIMENSFDYIYQPYTPGGDNGNTFITTKKLGSRTVKYIPTPLDYLDGKSDLPNMFKRINNLKPNVMASFFIHPSIEFEDIKITTGTDGYPSYNYSDQSALHQIINTIESKGYSFKSITELN